MGLGLFFLGPLAQDLSVTLFVDLPAPADGQSLGGHIHGDRGAGSDKTVITQTNRCHQLTVGANEDPVTQTGLVFLNTVVVTGDGTCSDIAVPPDFRIAQIGEMTGFAARTQNHLFFFFLIADLGFGSQIGTGANMGEGTHGRSLADVGLLDDTIRFDHRLGGNLHIAQPSALFHPAAAS